MKKYGILANPAKHSLSPVMHNAAFKYLDIDAEYGVFEIGEDDLNSFMESVKLDRIDGLSVSLPYKVEMMKFLNEIDDAAKEIGAVNTVVNRGGFLYGYNTDYIGAIKALQGFELKGKKVVVAGAGGAVRAIVYGLKKEGAEVSVFNRTLEKAEEIGRDFGVKFGDLEEMKNHSGDILIQATSIWTIDPGKEVSKIFPDEFIKQFEVVMDIIYKPLITPLLERAKALGVQAVSGDMMLLYQAAEQFKIWTGKEAPIEVMKEVLNKNLV